MDKAAHIFQKIAISGSKILTGINRAQVRISEARRTGASVREIGLLEERRSKLMTALMRRRNKDMGATDQAMKRKLEVENQVNAAALRAMKGEGPIGSA